MSVHRVKSIAPIFLAFLALKLIVFTLRFRTHKSWSPLPIRTYNWTLNLIQIYWMIASIVLIDTSSTWTIIFYLLLRYWWLKNFFDSWGWILGIDILLNLSSKDWTWCTTSRPWSFGSSVIITWQSIWKLFICNLISLIAISCIYCMIVLIILL